MIASILAYIVLGVGIPLNLYVIHKMWGLLRSDPGNAVLRDRLVVGGAVLLLIVVFGLLFLNNDLDAPILSFDQTKIGSRVTTLILAIVPAAYWLILYRDDR